MIGNNQSKPSHQGLNKCELQDHHQVRQQWYHLVAQQLTSPPSLACATGNQQEWRSNEITARILRYINANEALAVYSNLQMSNFCDLCEHVTWLPIT
jgi:hypothetical protein